MKWTGCLGVNNEDLPFFGPSNKAREYCFCTRLGQMGVCQQAVERQRPFLFTI